MQQQQPSENPRRDFLSGAVLGLTGGSLAALSPQSAAAADVTAKRTGLYPDGAPSADVGYTPGILATGQRLVFVSGQGPKDLDADMETQMRQTFDRIGLILKEAGAGFENVVIIRSFFVHLLRDLPIYRKVRQDYLVKPYPASTAVGTTELAIPGLEIEFEAVAII
ncbi:RutC family protein YjgH [Symmachiella dynata]|uniref:RutC family protein YjgH n=1 Tax=Symmachiella dynata TaxID=2527995 RepID=A0A517ZSX1_9PLAN|nr:Rid family hydrolase [Symmachiella dynata]QDT49802.1 RutC family protein YjgH [Symmachiella dynata]QDU45515.1 RutC family protein YjgH [Symmachiella dynata]